MSSSVLATPDQASSVPTETRSVGRKEDVSLERVAARRERVAALRMSGLTSFTIQKLINADSEKNGWGTVTIRTIERDIASFFQRSTEDCKTEEGLRLSAIAQIEMLLERAMRYLQSKDKEAWKPGEYMHALATAFKMQCGLLAAKGWMNRGQPVPQTLTHLQIFDQNAEQVVANRQLLQPVIDLIDECLAQS